MSVKVAKSINHESGHPGFVQRSRTADKKGSSSFFVVAYVEKATEIKCNIKVFRCHGSRREKRTSIRDQREFANTKGSKEKLRDLVIVKQFRNWVGEP